MASVPPMSPKSPHKALPVPSPKKTLPTIPSGSEAEALAILKAQIPSPAKKLPTLPPSKPNHDALAASYGAGDNLVFKLEAERNRAPSAPATPSGANHPVESSSLPSGPSALSAGGAFDPNQFASPTRALPNPKSVAAPSAAGSSSHNAGTADSIEGSSRKMLESPLASPRTVESSVQLTEDEKDFIQDNTEDDVVPPIVAAKKKPSAKKLIHKASSGENSDEEFTHQFSVVNQLKLNSPKAASPPQEPADEEQYPTENYKELPKRLFISEIKTKFRKTSETERPKDASAAKNEEENKDYKKLPPRQFVTEIKNIYRSVSGAPEDLPSPNHHQEEEEAKKQEEADAKKAQADAKKHLETPDSGRVKAFANWRPSLLKKQLKSQQSGLSAEDFAKLVAAGSPQGDHPSGLRRGHGPTLHKREHSANKLKLLSDLTETTNDGRTSAPVPPTHMRSKSRELKGHRRHKSGSGGDGTENPPAGHAKHDSDELLSPTASGSTTPSHARKHSRQKSTGVTGHRKKSSGNIGVTFPAEEEDDGLHSRTPKQHSRKTSDDSNADNDIGGGKSRTPKQHSRKASDEFNPEAEVSSPTERKSKPKKPQSALKKMIRKMDSDSDAEHY